MQVERQMEYAIRLADPEFHGEWEDILKLASLVNEVAMLMERGEVSNPELDGRFRAAIKMAYVSSGVFRHEIGGFPCAKQLILKM